MLASIKAKIIAAAVTLAILAIIIWSEFKVKTALDKEKARKKADDQKAALDRWKKSLETSASSRSDTRSADERLREHGRLRD